MTELIPPHPVIDPQAEAYRRRDVEVFASFYSDDITAFRNGMPFVSGIEDLKAKYKDLFDCSPNLTLNIVKRRIECSYVYDTELINGLRGNIATLAAHVRYKVEKSKIVEVLITF